MADLTEHFAAGPATDLPGHCKWCGLLVRSDEHLMHDPDGIGEPLRFCSEQCLQKASTIFDALSPEQAADLGVVIDAVAGGRDA